MNKLAIALFHALLVFFFSPKSSDGQGLRPQPINIAQGKKIEATATCGEDVSEPELFCKLATVPGKLGILGLSCDHCEPDTFTKDHSIKYAIDGTERWWQSPPLSRGLQYQKVNITIDLGQEYQVAYVIVKAGNAPRPGTWALEKSVDGGRTFTPWQYFATTNSDCLSYFGSSALLQSFKDDTTVTCTTSYSQVPPFENGEIHISLINGRPGAANFSYSQALQEWTRATHIRLRLLKVKTLLADLLPLARKDPSVTRRYFYSIKDISVGGICMCNGHADECIQTAEDSQFRCKCKHQTCGIKCEECCVGFVQKKWRPGTAESSNECEACNCHNHASDCYYSEEIDQQKGSLDMNGNYEGGGVCINCQDNTAGINCEQCKAGYYRPADKAKTDRDACKACTCDRRFSTGQCFDGDGRCQCLDNYSGPNCTQCNEGFYGFPNCKPCDCHPLGTSGRVCGPTGDQCPCKPNYTGAKCDQCAQGYYGFPNCSRCNCDGLGSHSSDCDVKDGQCRCRQMYTSRQCNQCSKGFYSFPECKVCDCDAEGTARDICNPNTGACICMENYAGPRCDVCNEGYYNFPRCSDCGCSREGSLLLGCDQQGRCACKDNYDGPKCSRCGVGFYSYPRCVKCSCDLRGSVHEFCEPTTGQCQCKGSFRGINCNRCRSGFYGFPDCQACQCNPAGIKPLPDGQAVDCSLSNEGQCDCKDNVQGLACTECKDGYYFLDSNNPLGCDNCECNMDGVIGGLRICDKETGQCPCKLFVAGRKCTRCKPGFYGLEGRKVFGCTGCDCDVGGAYDQFCDVSSGQCNCRVNVDGRDCSRPASQHYYPTLLQIKAEMEDGMALPTKSTSDQDVLSPDVSISDDGRPARFGFDESVFPGFSWRGYATMSDIQRAIKVTLDIPKTTRYHIIFYSITNGSSPVTGEVMLTPKGGEGSKQSSKVTFPVKQVGSANIATHHTVGEKEKATQFMLTKGKWDLILALPPASVLLDYVVALPQVYYEAYQLEEKVTKPCQVNGINTLCNQFSYLSTKAPGFFTTELETGYIVTSRGVRPTQLFRDEKVLQQLDFSAMANLDNQQTRVTAEFRIRNIGKYVLVLQYYYPNDKKIKLNVYLRYQAGSQRGEFNLQKCNYRFGCRQVAVDNTGAVKVFDVAELQRTVVTLLARDTSSPIAVDSVTAIPLDVWDLDFIAPSILCTTQGNVCIPTSYPIPKGAVTIEVPDASVPDQPQPPNKQDPKARLQYLGEGIHSLSSNGLKEGRYAAIVHYYQPKHSSFESQVKVTSDRAVEGSIKFHYCPHASGCRSVIKDLAGAPFFDIERKTVALEFEIPMNSSTWIDYVLLVPQNVFTGDLQEDAPVPLSQDFLDSCSKDDFFIKTSDPKFCKDSVFSLTTSFNNGSLPCDCNPKGSVDNNCETFGGQCRCRQNVIGRTCNRCKTGYYGFPECKRCRCVFCNEITGACDCPKNTVGPNCEFCLQGTCCYDPILGCEDCGCERFGVVGNNIACNPNTGQCNCKPSHTGKKCKKCAVGYFNYPLCQKCESCDPRGVDSRICDSNGGTCFCKPGVTGPRCDKCAAGRFNLDANNPDGCSKCWCNGLSKVCDSGNKYWSKINTMDNWKLENSPAIVVKIDETKLSASVSSQRDEKGKPIYWIAPMEYLGQKISSYGGKLMYTISYEVPQGESSPVLTMKPDIVIEGKNGKVLLFKKQLELSPGQTSAIEAQFLEYLWEDTSGSNVSRDDFMSVFHDIKSLKLRASYSTVVSDVRLSDVEMDVAVDEPVDGAMRAMSVEKCECPVKATGDSCELCGKGYTRAPDNTSCVRCNCFDHSEDCDGESGECYSCLHNTTGPNCEVCEPGFYGDATTGTPLDCNICECPLGIVSNSFATECSLNSVNDLICTCKEGYVGQRCNKCADGFYGDPSESGDYCKRCGCSGNIDYNVNGSCDSLTGECLKCINTATGDQCDRCLNGYYGDAVVAKNCARCACNDCGTVTAVCNHTTGSCMCKPNVIGESCDSCKPNTWNFDSCLGCEDCDCAPASLSTSCNVKTGQCECPEGVTGRRCDRCKAGYFEYTKNGCRACTCDKGEDNLFGFCDVNTGQCCKPGGNCTICPVNYILTSEGCQYCGECVGRLLKTATELDRNLSLALKAVKQGTAGIIAEGRFSDLNETLQRLIPPTNEYNSTMEELSKVVGMSLVNAANTSSGDVDEDNNLIKRTDSSEETVNNVTTMVMMITDQAKRALETSTSTKEEALELGEEIRKALNRTYDIIVMAEKIAKSLKNEKANQTLLLEKAEEILKELLERDFESANNTMVEERELVMATIERAKEYLNDTTSLLSKVMDVNKTLDELFGKFSSIVDESNRVLENVSYALGLNNISKTYDSQTPMKEAVGLKKEVDTALNNLEGVIQTAKDKVQNSSTYLQDFNESFPRLDDLIEKVDEKMANLFQILDDLNPLVDMAQNHSEELLKQADDLEKLLTDIEFARKAYNASERYSNIAKALKEALAIAQEAEKIAMKAKNESQSLSNSAVKSLNVSEVLNETVSSTEDKVDNELLDLLNDVKTRLALIKAKIRNVSMDLLDVDSNFPKLQELTDLMDGKGRELGENATDSKTRADDARKKAEDIKDQLSDLSGLRDSIVATNSNITEAEKQVMNGLNMSLEIREKVQIQEKRHQQILNELDSEVSRRLMDIKNMMIKANNLLKFTTPVMKFDGEATSSPLLPPAIKQEVRAMNILMYLNPDKPDGLVMFLGDAEGTSTRRQKRQSQESDCKTDYIAVQLKERKPQLKICTAVKGLVEIGVKDDDFEMETTGNVWYKLEVDMAGDWANLTIKYFANKKEEIVRGRRSLKLDNPKIVFNEDSDLIVGGVPLNMKLPSKVEAVNYTGCIDGLEMNYHFVGSWNTEILEKPSKNEVCPSRKGATEFAVDEENAPRTFFGTGYVKSGPYQEDDPMGTFDLKFRTTSSNGILVIAIDDDDASLFQALELINGRVVLSYNMGHGYRKLTSKYLYDNGVEVTIEKKDVDRRGFSFSLSIRSEDDKSEMLADRPFYKDRRPRFVNADFVYWGGMENRTAIPVNVTKSFFKGCLSDMKLSTGEIKVQPSPGYIFGCKVKPAHNVTFLGATSYLAIEPFLGQERRGFNIGLSFRVDHKTKNGLIFLETHGQALDFIALGLIDGKLRFSASPGNKAVSVTSKAEYNDGKWHFVLVRQIGIGISLRVDDEDPEVTEFENRMQQLIQTTNDMYLGGIPENYMDNVRSSNIDNVILNSLKGGSIRDLTFDQTLFDFEKYKRRRNVIFDNDDYSEPSPKLDIIEKPPDIGEMTTTTSPPPSTTTGPPTTTTSTPTTTTTSTPTTTTTTPPQVCQVPEKPAQENGTGVLGFGYDLNSHAMYTVTGNKVLSKLISSTTDLSFDFRASNPDGIILYTAINNDKQADFIVCNLLNGDVSCGFSAGGGILRLTSADVVYSDGTWHTVQLTRDGVDGKLFVDGTLVMTGAAAGSPKFINGLKELYLGGTPQGFDAKRVTVGARASFPGCIRNVKVNNDDIGEPSSLIKVQDCYIDSPTSGVSFDMGGGYLQVAKTYTVGMDEVISMEIKPTSHTGLLLSSSNSKGDYIVFEIIRGNVIFRAENGGGQLVVENTAEDPLRLCDGQWHKIRAWKEGNLVKLQVDEGTILEGERKGSQTNANIYDPLYVGGLPAGVEAKGVTATERYTGCIRNLESKDRNEAKSLKLANPVELGGNVYLGGCPYN